MVESISGSLQNFEPPGAETWLLPQGLLSPRGSEASRGFRSFIQVEVLLNDLTATSLIECDVPNRHLYDACGGGLKGYGLGRQEVRVWLGLVHRDAVQGPTTA